MRVGIIGCGVIAPTHIEAFRACEGVDVAWVCDLLPDRLQKLADTYAIPGRTLDYREVLADPPVDVISVCTDHASHAPIAIAAMEAGKHVLVEKALAANREGLDAMVAAHARRPDLVFGGVFQHRFDALNRVLKKAIGDGVFGQVLTAGMQMRCLRTLEYYRGDPWRGTWAREGGAVLINQAIHFIDILAWVMGGVKSVCGTYANLTHGDAIEAEDTAVAALRFRNGAAGLIEATSSSHLKWEPNLSFHGTHGSLDLRNGAIAKLSCADKAQEESLRAALAGAQDERRVAAGKGYYGFGHAGLVADFVAAIRERRAPYVTGEAARHAVDVVLAIYRSWEQRRWVRV